MTMQHIMYQFFEWDMVTDQDLWDLVGTSGKALKALGVQHVWLPPATKGTHGLSMGYDTYDLYDLGEFDQKGTVKTRFGSKAALVEAIASLHQEGIKVLADVVLNHKGGGDETELFQVVEVNPDNRLEIISEPFDIEGWTKFLFPGRGTVYSAFKWNFTHFTSTDWDERSRRKGLFKILGENKDFSDHVDTEHANYDYLMFADINLDHPDVKRELMQWAKWFVETIDCDGFRLDAIKHMDAFFIKELVTQMKRTYGDDFFVVGEYWSGELEKIEHYLDMQAYAMHVFDAPLHYRFVEASNRGKTYPLPTIFNETVVAHAPLKAVTFVDNHDSQNHHEVAAWFKPLAYALILLRQEGYPCLFYGDYPINQAHETEGDLQKLIQKLAWLRKAFAYGSQSDYFDHDNVIGWVRAGDEDHQKTALAVVMSNGDEGFKDMVLPLQYAGRVYSDALGHCLEDVVIDEEGLGRFYVQAGSVSVWMAKE